MFTRERQGNASGNREEKKGFQLDTVQWTEKCAYGDRRIFSRAPGRKEIRTSAPLFETAFSSFQVSGCEVAGSAPV